MLSMLLLAMMSRFFIASAAIMFLLICCLDPMFELDPLLSNLLEFPRVSVTVWFRLSNALSENPSIITF